MRVERRPAEAGGHCAPAGALFPDGLCWIGEIDKRRPPRPGWRVRSGRRPSPDPDGDKEAGEAMREEIEVVEFHAALATRRDGEIVIALFDGAPMRCVGMWICSSEAACELAKELGSALAADDS